MNFLFIRQELHQTTMASILDDLGISSRYTWRARLQPALLVALPLAITTLAFSPAGLYGWGAVWSAVVLCGGTALLSQFGRDFGKKKEPGLFAKWGGKPTSLLLRHNSSKNRTLLERRHRQLLAVVDDIKIPTLAEERANPAAADDVYDACVTVLRDRTRKKSDFPLIFEENCNYGFRRNLWGLRPFGLTTSCAGSFAVGAFVFTEFRTGLMPWPLLVISGGLDLFLMIAWLAWITPGWVRIAADAYGERLLEACETLSATGIPIGK